MTNKKLIEYLSGYDPESPVVFIVADTEKRLHHKISGYVLITDAESESPVVVLETTESFPLDEVLEVIEETE